MNIENAKKIVNKYNQSQLLKYYDELTDREKAQLLEDISKIDFAVLDSIESAGADKDFSTISPIPAINLDEIGKNRTKWQKEGIELLKKGKVAAVILAGGQGTRLGFDKPKGMYDIGITRKLPIFGQLMENILSSAKLAGYCMHLFIMTSEINNADTVEFFKDNDYFGYPADKIHFYIQDKGPVCDFDGKILLSQKSRVAFSPNGNGNWYKSLIKGGFYPLIESEGIEWLNVFGVDNVLQRICDPVFVGATHLANVACSAKVVKKVSASERVGVLCMIGGKPDVVEYYEMPEELASLKDEEGNLVYPYGVILNYLFSVKTLNEISKDKLPFHIAKKKVGYISEGKFVEPEEPNAYKFETLAVDLVRLAGTCLAFEVEREKEFAPIKNSTGVDSVETARELLTLNGIKL